MDLSLREMPGPAIRTFLLLVAGGISAQKAVSPSEEWGEMQSPFWVPPSSRVTLGRQRGHCELHFHLCFVKPLQLLSFNQLLCLLLQLPSLSESPFCLQKIQRERKRQSKHKYAIAAFLQPPPESQSRWGWDWPLEMGLIRSPAQSRVSYCKVLGAEGKHSCRNTYMHLLCWL